jgi:hypothetical protein
MAASTQWTGATPGMATLTGFDRGGEDMTNDKWKTRKYPIHTNSMEILMYRDGAQDSATI